MMAPTVERLEHSSVCTNALHVHVQQDTANSPAVLKRQTHNDAYRHPPLLRPPW
eukprot:m.752558 g.752558  ORF g.752558 m.752558 type:complete len:54 (+) comp23169_c0_seq30:1001-1162(+)